MKQLYTSVLLVLFFSFGLSAQNYRMVNSNSELFFTSNTYSWPNYPDYELYGLKCDSIHGTISDSTYFIYRTIKAVLPADSACSVDAAYPIWAGPKIIINNNNRHSFHTISGDSLIIDTQTNPGDSQQIYLYANGNRIIAIHTSSSLMTFASLSDSVKTYVMQLVNPSNVQLASFWNGKTIIVSKNNGVVQMPVVLNFPNDTTLFSRVAAKRLKYGDLYPWQAGDELHESAHSVSQFPPGYGNYWTYNKFILSRTMINPDSVQFSIRRITHHTSNAPPTNTISIDTFTFSVGHLSSYVETTMPQQTIFAPYAIYYYDLFADPSDCGKLRMIDHVQNQFYINSPGCYQENNFEPAFHDNIYLEGVAGYYFHDFPSAVNSVVDSELSNFYFYIGSTSCGTPLYLGTTESSRMDFKVWPNPVTDFLNFEFPENYSGYTFEIFDLTGKEIQKVVLENNMPVNVSNLTDGFYLGKIISSDGNQKSVIRFVKSR